MREAPMNFGSKIKKSLVAATVAAGILAAAVPAEARSLRRGFLPGLLGGFAIAAMAASAQAAQQQERMQYTVVPTDLDDLGYWDERPSEVVAPPKSLRRAPRVTARTAPRPRPQVAQTRAETVERCENSLASRSRAHGSTAVNVTSAGPEARTRDGSVDIPVVARIEYARNGRKQVRQARVTCTLNPKGQVVAFR
jgi:hypothetical protein